MAKKDEFADFPDFEEDEQIPEALTETADKWRDRRLVRMDKAMHDIDENLSKTLKIFEGIPELMDMAMHSSNIEERAAASSAVLNLAVVAKARLEWISQRINEGLTVKE